MQESKKTAARGQRTGGVRKPNPTTPRKRTSNASGKGTHSHVDKAKGAGLRTGAKKYAGNIVKRTPRKRKAGSGQ
jgi:hypothetical protein